MSMRCKFCGCTDRWPCLIPTSNRKNARRLPCSWLLPNVCTSPACVEKAYIAVRIVEGGFGFARPEVTVTRPEISELEKRPPKRFFERSA